MIFLRYDDVPGVIGRVGTLLGEAGVNIANMAVSRNREGGKALMVLSLDAPASTEVVERLARRRGRRLSGDLRMTHFWHPFADMRQVAGNELVFERGEGVWIYDSAGNRYLDASGSLWYANVGHGRRELADAAAAQLSKLEAYSAYDRFATRPAVELAERISALAPMPEAAVFFTTAGSDAVESAVKLARRYWTAVGRPGKHVLVAREKAYHGVSGYGTSPVRDPAEPRGLRRLAPGIEQVPLRRHGRGGRAFRRGDVAAFIGEPVIGAGGVYPPPDGYWPAVASCAANMTSCCPRRGDHGLRPSRRMVRGQRYGVEPDLFTFAKGVTSGYVPLGGVVVGQRVRSRTGVVTPACSGTATRTRATPRRAPSPSPTSTSSNARDSCSA